MTEQVRPRFSKEDINLIAEALIFYADSLDEKQRELRKEWPQKEAIEDRAKVVQKIRACEKVVIQLKRITGEIKPYDYGPHYEYIHPCFLRLIFN